MKRNDFYRIDAGEKETIFQAISNQTGMPAFAVEKDWWVTQTLAIIFEMDTSEHLVFKGGSSLSKAWKLIERFSEDIDLAIDRGFLGFTGDLSKKQRTALRKAAGTYTSEKFFEELSIRFSKKGFRDASLSVVPAKESDQDPRIIEVHYPNIIPTPGYLLPKVQIEIGCRSLREPFTIRTFGSLVDEVYPDKAFAQPLINIPTVDAERTFLEKIFLLHEEFHRPINKIRVNRLSRHLYDIYRLSRTEAANRALHHQALYETIVEHRYRFSKVGGVDYNDLNPERVDPMPHPEVISAWGEDYKKMLEEMIYEEDPPSFAMLIKNIDELKGKLKGVGWKFSLKFPMAQK
ncbi:MAG: nucleotidyl transferase AbiEii/AbiGii toxin family protein [Chitinophagaceae bacterium]|nr:MAG: nucleotidyl transferase AbiEii/AbiGii toxin family protein [Chitinophagaceae bacterium]